MSLFMDQIMNFLQYLIFKQMKYPLMINFVMMARINLNLRNFAMYVITKSGQPISKLFLLNLYIIFYGFRKDFVNASGFKKAESKPEDWIFCDSCHCWFHFECVGIEEFESVLIDQYSCEVCTEKYGRKTSSLFF